MRHLVVTDSVHATAAACDYLERRATDEVVVATAADDDRDAGDAANVARARLAPAPVETAPADGADPVEAVLGAAADAGADEMLLPRGVVDPEDRARLVAGASRPVVVVPGP